MFIEIKTVKYLGDYRIEATFNDGARRIFDFLPLIEKYLVFAPLRDLNLFRNFTITDTLEWNGGDIDIAPEHIYEFGKVA